MHAIGIPFQLHSAFVHQVIEVGHGFACRHDEISIIDPAPEQRREDIHGPFWLRAQRLQLVQAVVMFAEQRVKTSMGAAKRVAMR